MIQKLIDRMASMTSQLKTFAYNKPETLCGRLGPGRAELSGDDAVAWRYGRTSRASSTYLLMLARASADRTRGGEQELWI